MNPCMAKGQSRPRRRKVWLPPLPSYVYSPIGDVPVFILPREQMKDDKDPGSALAGYWAPRLRQIAIADDLEGAAAWTIFVHERTHMWLDDAGVDLPTEAEERVCNVIATATVAEMVAKAPTRPPRK